MKESKKYRDLFNKIYNNGAEIIDQTTGAVFEPTEGEIFKQCWADTIERRNFPKYWFISDLGNLLSIKEEPDRIQWLHKNKRANSNKISYKFFIQTENGSQLRNVEEHNLVALVHGSGRFGLADALLEEKGLDAFGVNSSTETNVQGHHINGNDADNRPENIKLVTDDIHVLLGSAPKFNDADKKHFSYMKKMGKVMNRENPNAITVLFTGETMDLKTGTWKNDGEIDVISTDRIALSKESVQFLKELLANTLGA